MLFVEHERYRHPLYRVIACIRTSALTLGILLWIGLQSAIANDSVDKGQTLSGNEIHLKLSTLSSFQVRNDVQVPNSVLGSRFSLSDAVGQGPTTSARVELNWMFKERHGLRVLLAPLTVTDTVRLDEPVRFAGEAFDTEQITEATYRFNSWRLGYHYLLRRSDVSRLRVGATLKVRDAEIRLAQGDTVSFTDDLGFVPLLYVAGEYRLGNRWTFSADLDGLAGGPGRAIDLGLGLNYSINQRWQIGAEVRVLDGGADVDTVYNFAQFNSAALVISTGF